jgi:hypothetical protein
LRTAALVLALTIPAAAAHAAPARGIVPELTAADRALLRDAIDIHVHLDPDSFGPHSSQAARELDAMDMGRRAKAARMRGFVIKQHYDQTAQMAYMTRKAVPGVEAFGMMVMNLTVGGLNPEAIHHFTEVKGGYGRIVSMPTWDSENNVVHSANPKRKFVAVSKDGELLPEAKAAIEVIAKAKMRDSGATLTLATGHIAAEEALLVIREARKQGVTRIVATHAMGHPVSMTVAQMKEAVSQGAYIEFVVNFIQGDRKTFEVKQYVDAIRELGVDHVILSSDGGQIGRPFPDESLAQGAAQLRAAGMTTAELHKMMAENPATLLGVPKPGAK